jgi:hypothetical protein
MSTTKTKTATKVNTKTTTKPRTSKYQVKVATGVYQSTTGTYAVRKQVNGVRVYKTFTSKTKAIAFYKSL